MDVHGETGFVLGNHDGECDSDQTPRKQGESIGV